MPSGTATTTMHTAAMSASGSVTGNRLAMRRATGRSYWIEVPRSPRRARASQSPYGTIKGRARPRAVRRRAAVSGLRSMPRMMSTGSPGSTRTTRKTRRETKRRVAASAATLRTTYRLTRARRRLPGRSPRHLGEISGGDGQVLPHPLHAFLRDHQARVDVEPHGGGLVHEHLLELHVLLAPGLVVEGDFRLLEQLLELRAVETIVILRVGVVGDVPRFRVPDDREVVVRLAPHARQPLAPLDLLDLHVHAHLLQLV